MTTAWNHVRPTRKRKRERQTSSGSAPPDGTSSQRRLKNDAIIAIPGWTEWSAWRGDTQAGGLGPRCDISDTYGAPPVRLDDSSPPPATRKRSLTDGSR